MYYKITDDKDDVEILKTLVENIVPNTKDGKSNVEMDTKIVAYNIVTTSDKVINGRMYPDAYVKITALEDRWVQRFAKPFLVNHDIYTEALGRMCDAVHYKHSDGIQTGGKEQIPSEVIDYFKSKKCFDEGTASIIVKIILTKDSIEKIKSSVYFTTSQSSATDGYVCNICGSSYFECNHSSGRQYEKDGKEITCIPQTKELYPIENSSVNSPANDTSILVLFDTANKKIILNTVDEILYQNENQEENGDNQDSAQTQKSDGFDKNKIIEDNAKIENKKQEVKEMGTTMTADQIKAGLERIKASDTAAFEKAVTAFCGEEGSKDMKVEYKNISDESLPAVNKIVDSIIVSASEKIKTLEDKLKESEEKIKALEAAAKDEEVETGDSSEEENTEDVNKKDKPSVKPKDEQQEEEKEEPQETKDDVYSMFQIKSKKGGNK